MKTVKFNSELPNEQSKHIVYYAEESGLSGEYIPKRDTFWNFDCWDKNGASQTITIEALNKENATIIFKAKHEGLGFDPPY